MIGENAKTYLTSFVHDVRQIDTLRRVELSLLVLGLSFALASDAWRTFVALGTGLVLIVAGLELAARGEMQLRVEQATTLGRQAYMPYPVPAPTASARTSFTAQVRAARHALTVPSFIGWNLALICFLLLVSLMV